MHDNKDFSYLNIIYLCFWPKFSGRLLWTNWSPPLPSVSFNYLYCLIWALRFIDVLWTYCKSWHNLQNIDNDPAWKYSRQNRSFSNNMFVLLTVVKILRTCEFLLKVDHHFIIDEQFQLWKTIVFTHHDANENKLIL